ncbi:MAG: winged helix-turn-helix domain-containing protein [Candidatus Micrarchaeota archaeon]
MAKEITLDSKTFKALAIDSRVQIMKALASRRKTQTELAKELKMSAPTVSEHLYKMHGAGLVAKIDDGHKWQYYELTEKGRTIVSPRGTAVFVFALTAATILMFAGLLGMTSLTSIGAAPGANELVKATYGQQGGALDSAEDTLTAGASAEETDSPSCGAEANSAEATTQNSQEVSFWVFLAGTVVLLSALFVWKK